MTMTNLEAFKKYAWVRALKDKEAEKVDPMEMARCAIQVERALKVLDILTKNITEFTSLVLWDEYVVKVDDLKDRKTIKEYLKYDKQRSVKRSKKYSI